jgi:Transposase
VNLNEVEKQKLFDLLEQSPCLTIAYELKEELREIYETSFTVKMGSAILIMERVYWISAFFMFFKNFTTLL